MSDTREMTMEEGARRSRDSLVEDLARLERVRELNDRAQGRFGLDDEFDRVQDELREMPLSAELEVLVEVTLGTGGPAHGVTFECHRSSGLEGDELELDRARVWYQDWFKLKGYVDLDDDTAQQLFDLWGLAWLR